MLLKLLRDSEFKAGVLTLGVAGPLTQRRGRFANEKVDAHPP